MEPVIYTDICQYVVSAEKQVERLERLGQMIDGLLVLMAASAVSGNYKYEEYQLNDGQTMIRTRFRSASDMQNALEALNKLEESMLARLNNQVTGRVMRMVPGQNFIPSGTWR